MSPFWYALRVIQALEDHIVAAILRQPGFHRAVGRVHRAVQERKHGRDPQEPLAPGEATEDPNSSDRSHRFLRHFVGELKNQMRGKPTDLSEKPPK